MRRPCARTLLSTLMLLQGCYTYAPLQTESPPVGESVQLSISDRGRVELSERLGRGVASVRGRIAGTDGTQLLINVSAIRYLSGENSRWSGETMRLDRSLVDEASVRTLSRSRTWVAAGLTSVAVIAFVASRGLFGTWTGDREEPQPPPPVSFVPRFRIAF